MANRNNTFLLKRSGVPGKIPSSGQLLLGELALNTSDAILYTSGTTANSILPIGWDRVARTGDTMTGTLYVPTISATTYLNLPPTPFTGGTVTGATNFTNGLTANTFSSQTINVSNYAIFETGTTTPSNVSGRVFYDDNTKSLAYYSYINPNIKIKIGRQLYSRVNNNTGSIITKGSAITLQSASNGIPNATLAISSGRTNNQVAGLAAADIAVGDVGEIITQGVLSGLTLNTFNIGDIVYLSDTIPGTYVNSTASLRFNSRTHQIGYIIATGSTTGEIYVSINNEDTNLSLTDIERNILEGNVISTGAYEFTGITVASTTTVNVAPMRGWIVNNTYNNATLPSVINLYYTGDTGITITNINISDSTYLLVNSASTLYQQITFPTPQERRENIFLGKVIHPNKLTIQNVNNTVDFDVSPMAALRDLWTPLKLINQGVVVTPNGANKNINTSAGTLWGNGINWVNNQLNPDSVTISGTSPTTFQYRVQTGGTFSNTTTIDVANYDLNGVVTAVGGGSNSSTNQRVYLFPTGLVRIQYGQHVYGTLAEAVAGAQTEQFIEYANNRDNGILIGIISINKSATLLNNTAQAVFNFVSKFGEVLGGTGGISTTTLQQAYDNSTTPEIITNATLGALSVKNGTGNADNVTRVFEGQASTNGVTSFIRADGYISGSTFQSNGFIANNDGVTATTVSASTLITPSFRANNGGITATTVSATTYYNLPNVTLQQAYTASTSPEFTINSTQLGIQFRNNTGDDNTPMIVVQNNAGIDKGEWRADGTLYTAGIYSPIVSATTYYNLPIDIRVTGGTYDNNTGVATFTNNTGGTFNVSGFGAAIFTGGTVTGPTNFTNGLTANTISATTYYNLPTDVYVTGGTYSANSSTIQFTNNTGGTFNVTGITTGVSGDYLPLSGGTVSTAIGVIISGNSSSDMLRITQVGSGNSIIVEDSVNPDSSPFVVDSTGKVGIGTQTPNYFMEAISNGGTDAVMLFDGGTSANANLISRADTTIKVPALVITDRNDAYSVNNSFFIALDRTSGVTSNLYVNRNDAIYVNNYQDKGHYFVTNNSGSKDVRMSILSNGNVGIGVMSASTKLQVSGDTLINGGLTANTISATTYYNLPTDVYVTGGTYSAGTAVFTNNTGGTFNVSGFSTSTATEFTGGTVTGSTIFTGGLNANTISATTYYNLPTDVYLTAGTYSNGIISFTNTTGGTFNVNIPANYAAGVISGATGWTSTGTGQINLPAVKVALYNNSNNIEPIMVYDVASGTTGTGGISGLTNNDTNYVVIEYNSGSPRYAVYDNDGVVDDSSVVLFMVVYRANNFVHTLEFGNQGAGLANKLNDRFIMTDRFGYESGLALGLSASTGVVTLSAGVAWNGPNRQSLSSINSQDDIFFKNFHSGGTWTYTTTASTINNTYYDDGTDIVVATGGKYLVNWYFRGQEINDHLYEVYGVNQYDSVALAQLSTEPSLPELITSHAILLGRIIVLVGANTGLTESAFITPFQSTQVTAHNDLNSIQGGTAGQYYHLTSTQYNNLALTNTDNNFSVSQTFNSGLKSSSVSATTYLNLPTDIRVTGGTYSNSVATFTNNTGGTFTVTGLTTPFTGGTVTGATNFTNGLTANTISATTYANLPTDIRVTGSTYNNNTFTYTNNTGGTFNVLFNTVTGLTTNGNLTVTGNTSMIGTLSVTGNTNVRAMTGTSATISGAGQSILTVIGSGTSTTSPLFTVQGSSGELFSVSDSLTGSLFSVNDISGLPILEVFSDNTTLMGNYLAPSLNTTTRVTLVAGSNTVYSIPTSAYTGAFFDYTVISTGTTGARAGTIMSIWSGTTAQYTDVSTNDIGTTTGVTFSVGVVGNNAILSSSATTSGWILKGIVRSI